MGKLGQIKSLGTAGTYTGHQCGEFVGALGPDTQVGIGKKSSHSFTQEIFSEHMLSVSVSASY